MKVPVRHRANQHRNFSDSKKCRCSIRVQTDLGFFKKWSNFVVTNDMLPNSKSQIAPQFGSGMQEQFLEILLVLKNKSKQGNGTVSQTELILF